MAMRMRTVLVLVLALSLCSQRVCAVTVRARSQAARDDGEPAGVSKDSSKQVLAVLDTLKDILASLDNQEKEETKSYGTYEEWCASEKSGTEKALEKAKRQLEESEVSVKELTATEEHLQQVLGDTAKEIQEASDTVSQATNVRNEDNEKYTQDITLNRQSTDQIGQAISILGKVHGGAAFLQQQQQQQQQEPGESSAILGIMKGLKDRLTKSGSEMDAAEQTTATEHNELMTSEKSRISALQETKNTKMQEQTQARVALVSAERSVKKYTKEITDLETVLSETTSACDAKAEWWKVRQEDRTKEKAALSEAIAKFPELMGTLTKASAAAAAAGAGAAVLEQQPLAFVQVSKHASHSNKGVSMALLGAADAQIAALEVSGGNKKGAMDAAKTVVTKLIGVLQEEQAAETEKKKYCEAALEEKEGEKAAVQAELERLEAAITRKTNDAALLKSQVADIHKALDEMQKNLEKATSIRKSEKATYESTSKDRKLALKVLAQAKEVLTSFYKTQDNTASLAQRRADPPSVEGTGKSSRKDVQSQAAVDMLEMVASDIAKEQKDADLEEKEAETDFAKLQVDSRKTFDDQMAAATEKVKLKAKTLVQLGSDKETKTQKFEDLGAVLDQLQSLHGECDMLLKNYEQRAKARGFEVDQLKDVTDILSGSSVAARTGFAQEGADAMDEKERELLADMSRAASGLSKKEEDSSSEDEQQQQ